LKETKKGKNWHRNKGKNRWKNKKKDKGGKDFLIKKEVGRIKEPLLPCNRLR
jgi:hypothetical protein